MSVLAARPADERGQVTAMFTVLAIALLALGALVYDGGQILVARRQANDLARQAARAGAQAIDEDSIRAGAPALDPSAAEAAVRDFLARRNVAVTALEVTVSTVALPMTTGSPGGVSVPAVAVTFNVTQPTPLLALLGIRSRTITAAGTARSVAGVTGALG